MIFGGGRVRFTVVYLDRFRPKMRNGGGRVRC